MWSNARNKAAPDKNFFFLFSVRFLGDIIIRNVIKPLLNKFEAIQMWQLESQKDVMKLLVALNSCSLYFFYENVDLVPQYILLSHDAPFYWNQEIEKSFERIQKNFFSVMVDASASLVGTVRADEKGQLQIVWRISRIFTRSKQKKVSFSVK